MEYWEILLLKHRERGKDGLTIPFLIGSQKYLCNNPNQDIAGLINSMATSTAFETCIRYCMGTQTMIAEIRKQKNMVYYVQSPTGEPTNLSIGIMSKDDLGDNIVQLSESLADKFQDAIEAERFSAEPNVDGRSVHWREFTFEDIQFIEDSFNSF